MINLIKLQCPNCGANLEVKEDAKKCYCMYCATPILIQNDNEYYIHHIDDTRIKEAEAQKEIVKAKLEEDRLLNERLTSEQQERKKKVRTMQIATAIATLVLTVPIAIAVQERAALVAVPIIGLVLIFMIIPEAEKKNILKEQGLVIFPKTSLIDSSYSTVNHQLESIGFVNITCESLHDVKFGLSSKKDKVTKILIDGENPIRGKAYPLTSPIVIYYHGK